MHRLLMIAIVSTAVLSAGAADARYKRHHHPYRAPAVSRVAPAPVPQNAPRWWNGPPTCWSDEGYGRFTSCDNGGKGG